MGVRSRGEGRQREPLPRREVGALLIAEMVSTGGDQVARLALAALLFARTGSAALSAAAYAVSYLPWVVVGTPLARLGDRFPKRTVMAGSDLYRAAVCALLVIPAVPTAVTLLLIFALTCGEVVFRPARQALYSDIFPTDSAYARGTAVMLHGSNVSEFVGYGLGGVLIAVLGSRSALAVDAGSFVVSALLLRIFLTQHPRATRREDVDPSRGASAWQLVWSLPAARWALLLAVITTAILGCVVALAVPLAHQLAGGTRIAGALLAIGLVGATCGTALVARLAASVGRRLVLPGTLLLLSAYALLLIVHAPGAALAVFAVAGFASSVQLITQQTFMSCLPADRRAAAAGVAFTALNLAQAATIVVAGLLADWVSPSTVIGIVAVCGALVTLTVARPSTVDGPEGLALSGHARK